MIRADDMKCFNSVAKMYCVDLAIPVDAPTPNPVV